MVSLYKWVDKYFSLSHSLKNSRYTLIDLGEQWISPLAILVVKQLITTCTYNPGSTTTMQRRVALMKIEWAFLV